MLTIRAMADGKGYSARHLEHSDYYAEGERVTGRWYGRAAELLGLQGDVRQEDGEAIREGLDPGTGVFLRQRQSADRTGADGEGPVARAPSLRLHHFSTEINFDHGDCGRRQEAH